MSIVVTGIDVGGSKKGFHAVALKGGKFFGKRTSTSEGEITNWCREIHTQVIAVDAPCKWRIQEGRARLAELKMAAEGIACYYTPTEEKARAHSFYAWMLSGQKLYSALQQDYPLFNGIDAAERALIETFPHAVTCALAGKIVSAKHKRALRRDLLCRLGCSTAHFSNIDEIDAALCAFAGQSFASNNFKAYGDPVGGFVIVPKPIESSDTAYPRPNSAS